MVTDIRFENVQCFDDGSVRCADFVVIDDGIEHRTYIDQSEMYDNDFPIDTHPTDTKDESINTHQKQRPLFEPLF